MIRINENIVVPHQFEAVKSIHSQTVGRLHLSNQEGCHVGTARAIKLTPNTIFATLLKIPFLSSLLVKVLYGDYTYASIDNEEFYISTVSAKSSYFQHKVITQLNNSSNALISQDKIDALRAHLMANKEPFRKIARDESLIYNDAISTGPDSLSFDLTLRNGIPELLADRKAVGGGAFKQVYQVVNITRQMHEAVLTFKKTHIIGRLQAWYEFYIYQQLKMQEISHILGMESLQYDVKGNPIAITAYASGKDFYLASRDMNKSDKIRHMVTVSQAIAKMHASGFVHRDIKPQNIVIHENQAHLIDFGLTFWKNYPQDRSGTQLYIPPEIRFSPIPFHFASETQDVYAFGITLGDCRIPETKEIENLCTHIDPAMRITMEQAHAALLKIVVNEQPIL